MAHPRLPTVRERYAFCFGYCGVSETDVGGELTVDHFCPVSAGGDDCDENLVYACVRCNQYKGALRPEVTNCANEQCLLHPLRDDLAAHIREDERTGRLEGLTARGRFHIIALRLNRPLIGFLPHRTPRPSSAHAYLSTSSTCARNVGGRVTPRSAAVFRLTTNGNLSTRSMEMSAGVAPCRILWTKTAERWHSSRLSTP